MIYLLEHDGTAGRRSHYAAGDAHRSCVVRAASEAEARWVAAGSAGDEGKAVWLTDARVTVVAPEGPAEILGVF